MEESKYFLLVHKKLTGQLTTEEAKALDRWLEASPANRETADRIGKTWQAGKAYHQSYEPDVEKALAAFKAKLERDAAPATVVSLPGRRRLMRWAVAAAVALVLGLAGIWQVLSPEKGPSQVFTADESIEHLTLADGSVVWLNAGSKLTVDPDFGDDLRQLQLEGEAFFSVAHDAGKPFVVQTLSGKTKVLGTEFNVRAWSEEAFEEVLVKSGKVEYSLLSGRKKTVLQANQKAVYYRSERQLTAVSDTSRNVLAWQTGQLFFQDTPLKEVLRSIERTYRIKLDISSIGPILDCGFSTSFQNAEPEEILDVIRLSFQMELKKEAPDVYRLIGGSCS